MLEDNDYDDDNELHDRAMVVQHQKYTTRLYILILMMCIYILVYAALIQPQRRTIVVDNMNPGIFNQLYREHTKTLSCPCSTVSISYETFMSNNITFHEICSSFFISQQWIAALYLSTASKQGVRDFRATASSQFELLKKLCSFSQDIVYQNLIEFNNKKFVSVYVQQESQIEIDVNETIQSIKNILSTRITSFINYLRIIIRESYLISALNTNAIFSGSSDDTDGIYNIYGYQTRNRYAFGNVTTGQYFVGCGRQNLIDIARFASVENSSELSDHTYWLDDVPYSKTINGFFVGCTPFEALLQSTLICLYDINCLQLLVENFPNLNQKNFNLTNLVLSVPNKGVSINSLLDNLLIEQWSIKVNYLNYFDKCAPAYCTYAQTNQINLSYAITLFVSLYGGLIIILRLITPFLINLKSQIIYRNNNSDIVHFQNRNRQNFVEWLKKLNLFKMANERTENNIKQQKIMTRVYLTLLTSLALVLILFNTLKIQTVIQTVSNPSMSTYDELQVLHSDTLKCTCSNTIISYQAFTSLSASLHPICSSDLISNRWITILNVVVDTHNNKDWRNKAHSNFQLLSDLCQLANTTIDGYINQYLSQSFIAPYIITEYSFNIQLNATFSQFINSIAIYFNTLIDTIDLSIQVDQPFIGIASDPSYNFESNLIVENVFNPNTSELLKQTNFRLTTILDIDSNSINCNCASMKCISSVGFYNSTLNGLIDSNKSGLIYKIPGLVTSCSSMDSLLLSTLECFFSDSECFFIVMSYIKKTYLWYVRNSDWFDINPLVYNSELNRFPPNTLISDIVKNVMITQWKISFLYEKFYKTCAPNYCTYTQVIHNKTIIDIIVVFISMIGGLVFSLRLITPYLVTFVHRFLFQKIDKSQQEQQENRNRYDQLKIKIRNLTKLFYQNLIDMNIFGRRDFNRNIDQATVKYLGQWATRFYLVSLILGITILALYALIQPIVITKHFEEPSFDFYNQLIKQYGDKLKCSCQSIATKYNQFVEIQSTFHEICTSLFASNEWIINFTSNLIYNISNYHQKDYRRIFSAHLQFLHGICEISIESGNNFINEFLSSTYITAELTSEDYFYQEISVLTELVKLNSSKTITNLFFLIRSLFHGNAIISTYGTNFEYIISSWNEINGYFYTQAIIYDDNCSCDLYSNCTSQANLILSESSEIIPLNGLKIGCLPTESFRSSTLECFYNQSCIDLIQQHINYNGPFISSLSKTSIFPIDTTVNELIDNIFIEDWSANINYSAYFHKCSPLLCSYTYTQHIDIIYTITFLLGLQSGLNIVLRWISPKLIRIISKIYRYRKMRKNVVQPNSIPSIEISTLVTIQTNANPSVRYYVKILLICLITMFLIACIILFSIYIIPKENEITTSSTSTMMTTSTNLNTIIATTTLTTTYRPNCESIFEPIELRTIGTYVYSSLIILADFNNDNQLDIVFGYSMDVYISILLGYGNGTFATEIANVLIYPYTFDNIVAGDINNDNKLDIVLVETYESSVAVVLGNGDGTLEAQPVSIMYTMLSSSEIVLVDFNIDTYLDMALINSGLDNIYIYFGYGNGSFSLEITLSLETSSYPMSINVADFNYDNYPDIFVTNYVTRSIALFLSYGNGNFQTEKVSYTGGNLQPIDMSLGDLNNDNVLDIIISFSMGDGRFMFGFRNGTFETGDIFSIDQAGYAMETSINDFNNDGYLDIVVGARSPNRMSILYGDGHGNFLFPNTTSSDPTGLFNWVKLGDFNNDGIQDILSIDQWYDVMTILFNTNNCNLI